MKVQIASITVLTALFSLVTPVVAGGGLVSITSTPSSELLKVGGIYTVTATAQKQDNTPCTNCPIYFKFEDGLNSDYINMLEPVTDSRGQARAEVSSKTAGNKVIFAVLTLPNGEPLYKSSSYILNFAPIPAPEINPYPQPTIRPITINTFLITIDKGPGIENLKNSARQVTVSWNPVAGADYYNAKLRPSDYSNWAIPQDSPTANSSINLILSSNVDYYVQIDACNSSACISSKETLVTKDNSSEEVIKPLLGDQKIEELQAKVSDLEKQVAETQKKQGFLETQINNIISFLKSIFPFWK